MRHHAIIVTSHDSGNLTAAALKAERLGLGITDICDSHMNHYKSFMVVPDGSKEGWHDSITGDNLRNEFIAWLEMQRYEDGSSPLDWVEVQYGDDEYETKIVRDSDEIHRK